MSPPGDGRGAEVIDLGTHPTSRPDANQDTANGTRGDAGDDVSTVYGASRVKRRRRTHAELAGLDDAIIDIVRTEAPTNVRAVYYRCVARGAVPKTEAGYEVVQRRLLALRRHRRVRYADITDGTRYVLHPPSYGSVADALDDTARTYRRALWEHSDVRLQVFTEKDAITGVLEPVCKRWDVGLGVVRGFSSESFAWGVAESLHPWLLNVLPQFGDHDPSGVLAWDGFVDKVSAFASDAEVHAVRLAVTPEQIATLGLPLRATKVSSHVAASGWRAGAGSVEVDAIASSELRRMLDDAIAGYVDEHEVHVLREAERSERDILTRLAGAHR